MQGNELLFELRGADGHAWRLYLDGRIEGFPAGTLVVNRAPPMTYAHDSQSQSGVNLLYQAQQEAQIKLPSGPAGQWRDLDGPPQPGSQ